MDLDSHVLEHVFAFMPQHSYLLLGRVSKQWNRAWKNVHGASTSMKELTQNMQLVRQLQIPVTAEMLYESARHGTDVAQEAHVHMFPGELEHLLLICAEHNRNQLFDRFISMYPRFSSTFVDRGIELAIQNDNLHIFSQIISDIAVLRGRKLANDMMCIEIVKRGRIRFLDYLNMQEATRPLIKNALPLIASDIIYYHSMEGMEWLVENYDDHFVFESKVPPHCQLHQRLGNKYDCPEYMYLLLQKKHPDLAPGKHSLKNMIKHAHEAGIVWVLQHGGLTPAVAKARLPTFIRNGYTYCLDYLHEEKMLPQLTPALEARVFDNSHALLWYLEKGLLPMPADIYDIAFEHSSRWLFVHALEKGVPLDRTVAWRDIEQRDWIPIYFRNVPQLTADLWDVVIAYDCPQLAAICCGRGLGYDHSVVSRAHFLYKKNLVAWFASQNQ